MAAKRETQFFRACRGGHADVVRQLLRDGLSPETRDKYGLTGLIWAGRKGQIETATALVAGGADLDARDARGRTALSHAVAFRRYDFVRFIVAQGASLNPIDAHGWTPIDIASMPLDRKMVDLLKQAGAQHNAAQTTAESKRGLNRFSCSTASGSVIPMEVQRVHVQLSRLLNGWTGEYTPAVEGFSFAFFVDGAIRYTDEMKILGAQKARRAGNSLAVKIGVPESWWREDEPLYKERLTSAIEDGLCSMIAMLQRNRQRVNAESLLSDWGKLKADFLDTPAPACAAERQRAVMKAVLDAASAP